MLFRSSRHDIAKAIPSPKSIEFVKTTHSENEKAQISWLCLLAEKYMEINIDTPRDVSCSRYQALTLAMLYLKDKTNNEVLKNIVIVTSIVSVWKLLHLCIANLKAEETVDMLARCCKYIKPDTLRLVNDDPIPPDLVTSVTDVLETHGCCQMLFYIRNIHERENYIFEDNRFWACLIRGINAQSETKLDDIKAGQLFISSYHAACWLSGSISCWVCEPREDTRSFCEVHVRSSIDHRQRYPMPCSINGKRALPNAISEYIGAQRLYDYTNRDRSTLSRALQQIWSLLCEFIGIPVKIDLASTKLHHWSFNRHITKIYIYPSFFLAFSNIAKLKAFMTTIPNASLILLAPERSPIAVGVEYLIHSMMQADWNDVDMTFSNWVD